MQAARYQAPRSVDEAVRMAAAEPAAKFFAGGTDLLVQVKGGLAQPALYIDVKRIPGLTDIVLDASRLRLGAATPAAVVCEHAEVNRLWPGLVEAVHLIGSTQIQGRGSVGGNLCNSSPAADSVCALMVNKAVCRIAGAGIDGAAGERTLAVEKFCTGPGKNALGQGELLLGFDIPRPAPRTADAYLRLIPRTEMDIAVVGAGVSLTLDESGRCTAARVAIGAVAPTALLVSAAAQALIGSRVDEATLVRVAEAASAAATPIDDKRGTVAYRRKVVGVLARRAAASAFERARKLK
jgi:carbon-monoxide dehydrogenase medium subunit